MAFLSSSELRAELPSIITEGYDPTRIEGSNYELTLGTTYFETDSEKFEVGKGTLGDSIVINPGQFAFLITKEKVEIPDKYLGFISIKASIKFGGLVNISGFHVDPGFKGKLKYSVYNAGSNKIILTIGMPTFQLWLAELKTKADEYKGQHQNQDKITPSDLMNYMQGSVASPAELQKQIRELELNNRERIWLYRFLLGIVFAIFIKILWDIYPTNLNNRVNDKINKEVKSQVINMNIDSLIKVGIEQSKLSDTIN